MHGGQRVVTRWIPAAEGLWYLATQNQAGERVLREGDVLVGVGARARGLVQVMYILVQDGISRLRPIRSSRRLPAKIKPCRHGIGRTQTHSARFSCLDFLLPIHPTAYEYGDCVRSPIVSLQVSVVVVFLEKYHIIARVSAVVGGKTRAKRRSLGSPASFYWPAARVAGMPTHHLRRSC